MLGAAGIVLHAETEEGIAAVAVGVREAVDVDAVAEVVPVGAADATADMAVVAGDGTKTFCHGFARIFTDKTTGAAPNWCGPLIWVKLRQFETSKSKVAGEGAAPHRQEKSSEAGSMNGHASKITKGGATMSWYYMRGNLRRTSVASSGRLLLALGVQSGFRRMWE